jgi:hypothetical protein
LLYACLLFLKFHPVFLEYFFLEGLLHCQQV